MLEVFVGLFWVGVAPIPLDEFFLEDVNSFIIKVGILHFEGFDHI